MILKILQILIYYTNTEKKKVLIAKKFKNVKVTVKNKNKIIIYFTIKDLQK